MQNLMSVTAALPVTLGNPAAGGSAAIASSPLLQQYQASLLQAANSGNVQALQQLQTLQKLILPQGIASNGLNPAMMQQHAALPFSAFPTAAVPVSTFNVPQFASLLPAAPLSQHTHSALLPLPAFKVGGNTWNGGNNSYSSPYSANSASLPPSTAPSTASVAAVSVCRQSPLTEVEANPLSISRQSSSGASIGTSSSMSSVSHLGIGSTSAFKPRKRDREDREDGTGIRSVGSRLEGSENASRVEMNDLVAARDRSPMNPNNNSPDSGLSHTSGSPLSTIKNHVSNSSHTGSRDSSGSGSDDERRNEGDDERDCSPFESSSAASSHAINSIARKKQHSAPKSQAPVSSPIFPALVHSSSFSSPSASPVIAAASSQQSSFSSPSLTSNSKRSIFSNVNGNSPSPFPEVNSALPSQNQASSVFFPSLPSLPPAVTAPSLHSFFHPSLAPSMSAPLLSSSISLGDASPDGSAPLSLSMLNLAALSQQHQLAANNHQLMPAVGHAPANSQQLLNFGVVGSHLPQLTHSRNQLLQPSISLPLIPSSNSFAPSSSLASVSPFSSFSSSPSSSPSSSVPYPFYSLSNDLAASIQSTSGVDSTLSDDSHRLLGGGKKMRKKHIVTDRQRRAKIKEATEQLRLLVSGRGGSCTTDQVSIMMASVALIQRLRTEAAILETTRSTLKNELELYRSTFGPLPKQRSESVTPAPSASSTPSASSPTASSASSPTASSALPYVSLSAAQDALRTLQSLGLDAAALASLDLNSTSPLALLSLLTAQKKSNLESMKGIHPVADGIPSVKANSSLPLAAAALKYASPENQFQLASVIHKDPSLRNQDASPGSEQSNDGSSHTANDFSSPDPSDSDMQMPGSKQSFSNSSSASFSCSSPSSTNSLSPRRESDFSA